jgi:hypothetical protein
VPDVIAKIYLYPTDRGGKKVAISDGYGCPLKFDGIEDSLHDCRISLDSGLKLAPGETAEVPMSFLCRELFDDKLRAGLKFQLWEERPIGEGEVIKVLPVQTGD